MDGLQIDGHDSAGAWVRIDARTGDEPAACPGCGTLSRRVHSRYGRRLSDTAITSREVMIRLRARRLFCDNSDCGRRTFAEQVPRLAARHLVHHHPATPAVCRRARFGRSSGCPDDSASGSRGQPDGSIGQPRLCSSRGSMDVGAIFERERSLTSSSVPCKHLGTGIPTVTTLPWILVKE
ncbi:transposase family protein [Nocardia sp. NPDC059246]|uniref:transposase family protein n=1 Tax=unclassified Nocardia TaxID=2637762 RepID=UPI003682B82E